MTGCVTIVLHTESIASVGISDRYLKVTVGCKFCCLDLVVYVVTSWSMAIVISYTSCKHIWHSYIKKFVIVENNVIWKFWSDSEISDFTISTWLHVTAPFLLNE